jgi:DNA-binding response OmpR family regulator
MGSSFDRAHTIAVATAYAPLGRFIRLALTVEGYQPHLFADGAQALEFLHHQSFDAAVLDADLAKVDGFAICQHIRTFSSAPVVLLLMRGEVRQRVRGSQVGASAFLFIPFGVDELLGCLVPVLPNGGRPASEQA